MKRGRRRLILFARAPVPGRVKTRLIPVLKEEGATALYRRLLFSTFRTAWRFCEANEVDLRICFDGPEAVLRHALGDGWDYRSQGLGDLGQRMLAAFEASAAEGACATVIIGSDCPALTVEVLAQAFESLEEHPVVFGPARDGGYYLVGLARPIPELFRGIGWSTSSVLAQSLEIGRGLGLEAALLDTLSDVDESQDLVEWQRWAKQEEARLDRISVVIPSLDEAQQIEATLRSVLASAPHEVIVVDAGSADDTIEIARRAGVTVLESQPGRARQMNAGAALASGDVLLFVHADTELPSGWMDQVRTTLSEPGVAAGAFRFSVREDFPGRRTIEAFTNLRAQYLQSPYGDQALFVRRTLFEELGGFADLPIMEDYELNQRLRKRGRIVIARSAAITSGRRWRRLGALRTTLNNALVIGGFHLGISPSALARFYRGPFRKRPGARS